MKKLLALAAFALTTPALADNAAGLAAGLNLAKSICAPCHGLNGISMTPLWPNLAGQKNQYTVIQLQNFKKGDRKNNIMEPIAKNLSDQDMENVANYYAAQRNQ